MEISEIEKSVSITGWIIGVDFSRDGRVIDIAIETEDFDQYGVVKDKKSEKLFNHLLANVTVKGVWSDISENGIPSISVNEFEVHD